MKIAHIISTPPFAWATGGCSRVVYDSTRALAGRGNDVTVITTCLHEPGHPYVPTTNPEMVDGIRMFRYPVVSDAIAWKYKVYFSPGMMRHVSRRLDDYDIVHLQDLISPQAVMTARYCMKKKKPYILTVHGSVPWVLRRRLPNRLYYGLFAGEIMRGATKVIALNAKEAGLCAECGVRPEDVIVLPNGIYLPDFSGVQTKGEFRKKHSIGEDIRLITYVGRIHESKGIDLLLESMSMLRKRTGRIRLVLIGPDDGFGQAIDKMICKYGIENDVTRTGFLSDREKISALLDTDVFVIPKYSGFPVSFIEACACGAPLVTTDAGDDLGWIHGKVGLVAIGSAEGLYDSIYRLLEDDRMRMAFSEEAKKMASREYSWDIIASRLELLYKDALSAAAR